jgi:hypothetical protein
MPRPWVRLVLAGGGGALEQLANNNPSLREAVETAVAKSVRLSMSATDAGPSLSEFREFLKARPPYRRAERGADVLLGFHIQVSHQTCRTSSAGRTINGIVDAIGGSIPGPAQP